MAKELPLLTRREFLTMQVFLAGSSFFTAVEAVSSVALSHPELDMDEQHTWPEWEKM
jgi:hypothetical protein